MAEQLSARRGQTSRAAMLWRRAALGVVLVLTVVLSLGIGGVMADRVGISAVYVGGGLILALAGALGLVLLGNIPLHRSPVEQKHPLPE